MPANVFKKFDRMLEADLTPLKAISTYNSNYYHFEGHLLFGKSDDDDTTDWYIIRGERLPLCIGQSFCSSGEMIYTDECYRT